MKYLIHPLKNLTSLCLTYAVVSMIISLFGSFCALADGGDGVGNGGGAYVCRNPLRPNQITWATSVDLWEGANPQIHRLTIDKNDKTSAKEQSKKAVKKLFTVHEFFYEQVNAVLERVWTQIDLAIAKGDTGTYLAIIPDSRDVLRPKYCPNDREQRPEYEQVANFFSDSDIRIDIQLFQSLETETDRAALATHEAIYEVLRKWENQRDSVKARKINAYLYSTKNEEVLIDLLKKELTDGLRPERIVNDVYKNRYWGVIFGHDLEKLRHFLDTKVWVYGKQVSLLPFSTGFMIHTLKYAPSEDQFQILQELLQRKPQDFNVNEQHTTDLGVWKLVDTFLSIAVESRSYESIALLLQQPGIDPNRASLLDGISKVPLAPLLQALKMPDLESVRILLEDPRVRAALPSMNFREFLSEIGDGSDKIIAEPRSLEITKMVFDLGKDSGLTINDPLAGEFRPIEYAIMQWVHNHKTDTGEYIKFVLSRPEYNPNLRTIHDRLPLLDLFYWRYDYKADLPQELFHSLAMLMIRDQRLAIGSTEDGNGPLAAMIAQDFNFGAPQLEESQRLEYIKAMIEAHPEFDLREKIGTERVVKETAIEMAERRGYLTIQSYLEAELEKQEAARPNPEEGFFERVWRWLKGIFG